MKEEPQQQVDDDGMKETTAEMIHQLKSMHNPKYDKSEFMTFLKGLNQGALKIQGNELHEDEGKMKAMHEREAKIEHEEQ